MCTVDFTYTGMVSLIALNIFLVLLLLIECLQYTYKFLTVIISMHSRKTQSKELSPHIKNPIKMKYVVSSGKSVQRQRAAFPTLHTSPLQEEMTFHAHYSGRSPCLLVQNTPRTLHWKIRISVLRWETRSLNSQAVYMATQKYDELDQKGHFLTQDFKNYFILCI